MSNDSIPHTLETLEALPRKADVIEIAAALGLDTEGTRAEITARILEAQAGAGEDSAGDTNNDGSSSDGNAGDAGSDGSSSGDSSSGASDGSSSSESPDDDIIDADDAGSVEPIEEYSPPKPGPVCDIGKVALETVVASYFGVDEAPAEMPAIFEAIEAGKQPCVVVGKGNARFALEVFEELFDCDDVSRDVTEGVASNLARVLVDKNLFPRG